MRPLRKNTLRMWYVYPLRDKDKFEIKDSKGNFTGDFESEYSTPKLINISLYPTTGKILRDQYGIVGDFNYVSSTNLDLHKQGMLFENQPSPFSMDEYDYIISEKLKSVNGYTYGIQARA